MNPVRFRARITVSSVTYSQACKGLSSVREARLASFIGLLYNSLMIDFTDKKAFKYYSYNRKNCFIDLAIKENKMSGSHIDQPPTPVLDSMMMSGSWKIQAQLEKEIFLRTKAESLLDRQIEINDEINAKHRSEISSMQDEIVDGAMKFDDLVIEKHKMQAEIYVLKKALKNHHVGALQNPSYSSTPLATITRRLLGEKV